MTVSRPEVDIDRVMAELGALADKSDAPAPAVTRILARTLARLAGSESHQEGGGDHARSSVPVIVP